MKSIYLIFSMTPYKMASAIRFFTREKYNHVSVAFDEKLTETYSFCRHYRNMPFYGGLNIEKSCRYFNKGKISSLAVAKLDLSDDAFEYVRSVALKMYFHKDDYAYNMLSAAVYPFKKRILINNCYTCVEFSCYLLSLFDNTIAADEYHSITGLFNKYRDRIIYEGVFDYEFVTDEDYEKNPAFITRCRLNASALTEMFKHAKS